MRIFLENGNCEYSNSSESETTKRPIRVRRPKFTFKDIEETFNGEENQNVDEWIADYEGQANIFNWNDEEKMERNINQYCYQMIKIAHPAKIEEMAIISYIVNGVGATIDSKLFLSSASTISDLKKKLKAYECVAKKESTKI